MDPDAAAAILEALHEPFSAGEVAQAASLMAPGKSTALARYPIEYLRGHRGSGPWDVVALLFNAFVDQGYPADLNRMLLLPLHKKGDEAACDNYRGISLMHPLGRLFSKVVTARLLRDPGAVRADS